jgi:putative transposase
MIVMDLLWSYPAAMRNVERQETGRWLNNPAENSHPPFRRRERAMAKFRSSKSLQKFTTTHASVRNHTNQARHLQSPQNFQVNRSSALVAWHQIAA